MYLLLAHVTWNSGSLYVAGTAALAGPRLKVNCLIFSRFFQSPQPPLFPFPTKHANSTTTDDINLLLSGTISCLFIYQVTARVELKIFLFVKWESQDKCTIRELIFFVVSFLSITMNRSPSWILQQPTSLSVKDQYYEIFRVFRMWHHFHRVAGGKTLIKRLHTMISQGCIWKDINKETFYDFHRVADRKTLLKRHSTMIWIELQIERHC